MMRMTRVEHANATPEEVMDVILDFDLTPPGMTMAPIYETPEMAGSLYEWTFKFMGIPQKGLTLISEYVPGEKVSFRNFGAMESTSTMTFEPEHGGTRVTIKGESRMTLPLIGRFLDPVLKRGMQQNIEWTIEQIEARAAKKEPAEV